MVIRIVSDNVRLTKEQTKLIYTKMAEKLDQYLRNFAQDVKTATIHIRKRSRWGYKVNFVMNLPKKKKIYAEQIHEQLDTSLHLLRDQVIRQIKTYRDKLGIDNKNRVPLKQLVLVE